MRGPLPDPSTHPPTLEPTTPSPGVGRTWIRPETAPPTVVVLNTVIPLTTIGPTTLKGVGVPHRVHGGGVNPDRSVGVEGGRKPFSDVLMAFERKCCVIVLRFLG